MKEGSSGGTCGYKVCFGFCIFISALLSEFLPAWEGELSLLALMYAGIQSCILNQGTGVATKPRWQSRSVFRV